jgi:predicted DNA-binding transcriptional regulator AlpA
MSEKDFISEREAADLLPFSRTKLLRIRKDGGGPPHYEFDGRGIYYVKSEVIEWRESHHQDGGPSNAKKRANA